MPRPLLLIHGYSADGLDFANLYWALVDRKIEVKLLNVGNYISLNNEIRFDKKQNLFICMDNERGNEIRMDAEAFQLFINQCQEFLDECVEKETK